MREVPTAAAKVPAMPDAAAKPAPRWPAAASAEVAVPALAGRGAPVDDVDEAVRAGTLPVLVARPEGSSLSRGAGPAVAPDRVRVRVFDQAAAERARVRGLLLQVSRADGAAGDAAVALSVEYGEFATAYGADWASRLRLVQLPECALRTPERTDCAGTVLPSRNDTVTRTVTAQVPLAGVDLVGEKAAAESAGFATQGALLALVAGSSGQAGDYGATSLSPSATWSAGSSSGDFSWSYPMRNPPALGGPTPEMKLSYSAQSVDGRHAASNNQPSWVGEGFEFTPGDFIERKYRVCGQDMDGTGHNNTTKTGDLCWETDNATMSLGGAGGELLYNATDGYWHLRRDDGTKAERIIGGTSYGNGDDNGEYWRVTTADGTQFYFGKHKLDGWTSGDSVTNSTLTVPVYGNDPNEPCYKAGNFAGSVCTQAWRWNLDYVVDVHGNTMSYWYTRETNKYAQNNTASNPVTYTRDGYLTRIEYGTDNRTKVSGVRTDSLYRGVAAPMRVEFGAADRCLSGCTNHDGDHWPDTPWDQECTGSSCLIGSPTFWSKKRLSTVTTQVRSGSSYRNVERWTFHHTFPDPGDTTRAGLFLKKISHEGLTGTTTTIPDIEFTGIQLSNRVDTIDHSPAMNWWRLAMIRSESGGTVNITYSDPDCVVGSRMPTALDDNKLRCYPVRWTPEGYTNPITDYFHKYVVKKIYEIDQTGGTPPNGSPRIAYSYDYIGDPAWRYADDDGLIDKKDKTWSVWRGYATVGVTVGDAGEQMYTETKYFRGMHGDKTSSGTRTVTVTGTGVPTVNDEDAYAGMQRESVTKNGPSGAVISREVHEPWQSAATATRTINGSRVESRYVNVAASHHRVTLDAGRGDRVTSQYTTYDEYGLPTQVDDRGDTAVTGDEQCSKTEYARNTTAWLLGLPHTISTYAVRCADATKPQNLTEAQVISVERTLYDGNAHGSAPSRGLVTGNEVLSEWNAGTPAFSTIARAGYDEHGRVTETWDAMGKRSTTAYTPTTGGPLTRMVVTNPLLHTTTTELEPAWGLATKVTDANNKQTETTYDGLGRTTAVWAPGRDRLTETANARYEYLIRNNAPSVVTTRLLNPAGNHVSSYELYDGLLRPRQTQVASPSGGRLLTDTFYDTAGREVLTYHPYYAAGVPGTTLVTATERAHVPSQMSTVYDGSGRPVASIFRPYDIERYRTKTYYAGDRVDVTPPAGGTPTSTVGDAWGRTVELRQFKGTTPTGAYDSTKYRYNSKGQQDQITDPDGNKWKFAFDIRGRQVSVDDPDKGETTTKYNNADQVTSVKDVLGTELIYTYDGLGRRTAIYEGAISGLGRARWSYDTIAKGKLTQSTRYVGTAGYTDKVNSYNDSYQPTSRTITIPSSETGLGGTYTYETSYNVDGSIAAAATPAAADLPAEAVHHHYNSVSGMPERLTTIYGTDEFSYVADTEYNALGKVDKYKLYTGLYSERGERFWQSFTWELETGRLTGTRSDRESVSPYTVSDTRYTYDDVGNVTKMADVAAVGGIDYQCFRHDYLGRLAEAWTPGNGNCTVDPTVAALGGPAKYWLTWDIDAAGRRRSEIDHNTPTGVRTTDYAYPNSGSPRPHALSGTTTKNSAGTIIASASYTYDAVGNTLTRPTASAGTQELTWDAEGHLASSKDATGTTSYIYDAQGSRLIRRDPTGKTLYLPGQEVRFTTATGARACTRYYSFNAQTIASRTAAGLTWLSSDHQGTAQVSVAAVGQQSTVRRQTPYGTPRGGSVAWPNSKGFVGGTVDNTGLIHLGAREYDPGIGRFVSVDPVFNADAPDQMNGYAYANNSPVTLSDPTGLEPGAGWVYIGSSRWSRTGGGYRYDYRADYYLYCRSGGYCLGGIGDTMYWFNMAYRMPAGAWLVARVVVHVWRVALNFMGPVASPPKPRVAVPQIPSCPTAPAVQPAGPAEPDDELKGRCGFSDFACLFGGKKSAKRWWKKNKDWVTGVPATIGAVACIAATAGVCAVAAGVGLGVMIGSRVVDASVAEGGFSNPDNVGKMLLGMGIDVGASFIPGVRIFKLSRSGRPLFEQTRSLRNPTRQVGATWEQQFHRKGVLNEDAVQAAVFKGAGQFGYWGISAPDAVTPWKMGIPFTDPFLW